MDLVLIFPAFFAGLLTFLAPCTLPLVPGYLSFISGVSVSEVKDPRKQKGVRRKIFLNGLFYVAGFSLVFITLGTLSGLIGATFAAYRPFLSRLGGIFIILFGLFMLAGTRIRTLQFLQQDKRFHLGFIFKPGNPLGSFLFGVTFALGWTPCIGPILATVLFLASRSATVIQGTGLLAVFSLGLALPFLLTAAAVGWVIKHLRRLENFLNTISLIGGFFVIFLGILLLTNNFSFWVAFFYRLFNFINYDRLLNYL